MRLRFANLASVATQRLEEKYERARDPDSLRASMDVAVRATDMDGHPKVSMGSSENRKKALGEVARCPTRVGLRLLSPRVERPLATGRRGVGKCAEAPPLPPCRNSKGGILAQVIFARIEAHRPEVPSVATMGVVARTLLEQHGPALQPERNNAEGFVQRGEAEALVLAARSPTEKAARNGAYPCGFCK